MEIKVYFSGSDELFHFCLVGPMGPAAYVTTIKGRIRSEIRAEKRFFLLDMRRLEWANSGMIGVLKSIQQAIVADQGRLALYGVCPKVDEILRLTESEAAFNRFSTVQEAQAFLAKEAQAA